MIQPDSLESSNGTDHHDPVIQAHGLTGNDWTRSVSHPASERTAILLVVMARPPTCPDGGYDRRDPSSGVPRPPDRT